MTEPIAIPIIRSVIMLLIASAVIAVPTDARALAAEDAVDRIVSALEKKVKHYDQQRQTASGIGPWPSDVTRFARIERDKLPILSSPSLTSANLTIVSLGKIGEVVHLIETREITELFNPLGSGTSSSGTWARIRLLDGRHGWIFAEPRERRGPAFATFWDRKQTPETNDGVLLAAAAVSILVAGGVWWMIAAIRRRSPDSWGFGRDRRGHYSWSEDGDASDYDPTTAREPEKAELRKVGFARTGPSSPAPCPDCDAPNPISLVSHYGDGRCSVCHGTGLEQDPLEAFTEALSGQRQVCKKCGGSTHCTTCRGMGYIEV